MASENLPSLWNPKYTTGWTHEVTPTVIFPEFSCHTQAVQWHVKLVTRDGESCLWTKFARWLYPCTRLFSAAYTNARIEMWLLSLHFVTVVTFKSRDTPIIEHLITWFKSRDTPIIEHFITWTEILDEYLISTFICQYCSNVAYYCKIKSWKGRSKYFSKNLKFLHSVMLVYWHLLTYLATWN